MSLTLTGADADVEQQIAHAAVTLQELRAELTHLRQLPPPVAVAMLQTTPIEPRAEPRAEEEVALTRRADVLPTTTLEAAAVVDGGSAALSEQPPSLETSQQLSLDQGVLPTAGLFVRLFGSISSRRSSLFSSRRASSSVAKTPRTPEPLLRFRPMWQPKPPPGAPAPPADAAQDQKRRSDETPAASRLQFFHIFGGRW